VLITYNCPILSRLKEMPIYEYQCDSCGHELEKLQRISDDPLKDCPDCGEEELRRLVSAAGFRLKGAGWYETDFKKGDKKNLHDSGSSKSASSSNSTPSADNSKSAANKPAVKPASKPTSTAAGKS
jgi:putative FmdB family regulatory protein